MIRKVINVILAVVLFLIPLVISSPQINPDTYNEPKIFLLYTCGIALFACLCINFKKFKFDKFDAILLVFILLVCVSTYFSVDREISIFGRENRYEGLLAFLCYFLVYYCAKYYFDFNETTITLSIYVIFLTSVLSFLQYYNVPIISDYFQSKYYTDSFAAATFGNRNFFGSFISICLPYVMCLYIFYKKKMYLLVAATNFYALLVCVTRSAWLAFGVFSIFGIIYIIKIKNKEFFKRAGILLLTFILLFLVFASTNQDSFLVKIQKTISDLTNLSEIHELKKQISKQNYNKEKTENLIANSIDNSVNNSTVESQELQNALASHQRKNDFAASGRLLIWKVAIKLTLAHPLVGCGPDAFLDELYENHYAYLIRYLYPTLNYSVPDKAHNEYLQISATIGIPALLVYVLFLFITLICLLKDTFKGNTTTFIIFLCLVSYLVQAFFNISTIGVTPIFYFLLGFAYQSRVNIDSKKINNS